MVRLQIKIGVVLVFLALLTIGTFFVTPASASNFEPSQTITAPNIWDWGYTGNPNESEAFSVWANVTTHSGGLGVANVTINIFGPNVTVHDLMTFNGSFYEADVEAFPNPGEFLLYVTATDLNGQYRDGRTVYVTIEDDDDPTVDPLLTLPVVVSTSIVLAVIVMIFALMYDKRQIPIGENSSSSEIAS
ncbi:MAG: hypothetical protein E4H14_11670 [Candidatus Thorarchaeota archaeon]|nr:MAG: hypothetical protein E4H14_11670 [Candidatus Thorarchaeota archaeon]